MVLIPLSVALSPLLLIVAQQQVFVPLGSYRFFRFCNLCFILCPLSAGAHIVAPMPSVWATLARRIDVHHGYTPSMGLSSPTMANHSLTFIPWALASARVGMRKARNLSWRCAISAWPCCTSATISGEGFSHGVDSGLSTAGRKGTSSDGFGRKYVVCVRCSTASLTCSYVHAFKTSFQMAIVGLSLGYFLPAYNLSKKSKSLCTSSLVTFITSCLLCSHCAFVREDIILPCWAMPSSPWVGCASGDGRLLASPTMGPYIWRSASFFVCATKIFQICTLYFYCKTY